MDQHRALHWSGLIRLQGDDGFSSDLILQTKDLVRIPQDCSPDHFAPDADEDWSDALHFQHCSDDVFTFKIDFPAAKKVFDILACREGVPRIRMENAGRLMAARLTPLSRALDQRLRKLGLWSEERDEVREML